MGIALGSHEADAEVANRTWQYYIGGGLQWRGTPIDTLPATQGGILDAGLSHRWEHFVGAIQARLGGSFSLSGLNINGEITHGRTFAWGGDIGLRLALHPLVPREDSWISRVHLHAYPAMSYWRTSSKSDDGMSAILELIGLTSRFGIGFRKQALLISLDFLYVGTKPDGTLQTASYPTVTGVWHF